MQVAKHAHSHKICISSKNKTIKAVEVLSSLPLLCLSKVREVIKVSNKLWPLTLNICQWWWTDNNEHYLKGLLQFLTQIWPETVEKLILYIQRGKKYKRAGQHACTNVCLIQKCVLPNMYVGRYHREHF